MSGALLTTTIMATSAVDPVTLTSDGAYDSAISPADAIATWSIQSSGSVARTGGSSYTWLNTGAASDYEFRATETTGTVTSGTVGTWLSLGTNRPYTKQRTLNVPGQSEVDLTIEIRRVSDSVVIETNSISIIAEVL